MGIGISAGGDESGFRFKGNANFSNEREKQDGSAWSEGIIQAGNTVTASSGHDTTLLGGQISGNYVNLTVGHNLNLTSLQDSDDYDYDKIAAQVSGSAGKEGYHVTVGNNTNLTVSTIIKN